VLPDDVGGDTNADVAVVAAGDTVDGDATCHVADVRL